MVTIKNLTVSYGSTAVLKGFSANIAKGEITVIYGANGCGKTTLIKTVLGMLKYREGEILVNGKSLADYSAKELSRQIAFLPQTQTIPNTTVEQLLYCARFPYMGLSKTPSKSDRRAVENAINQTNINELRHKNLKSLSGGERQRVFFAMALAQDTDCIFLDEPTTYLDIQNKSNLIKLITALKNSGKTAAIVLHELSVALKIADRVILMANGVNMFEGTVKVALAQNIFEKIYNLKIIPVEIDGETEYIIK